MMPLKATCKILTIKLILKALLNHFLLILSGLLFKTFQSVRFFLLSSCTTFLSA